MNPFNPVGWFEIPVLDLDRAEKCYNTLFATTLARQPSVHGLTMSWFPWAEGAKGATGALVHSPDYQPSPLGAGVIIYFTVSNIAEVLTRASEAGATVIVPMTDIGEYGTIARLQDSEGNHICVHCAKQDAK